MTCSCANLRWKLNTNNYSPAVLDTLYEMMRNCKTFCKSMTNQNTYQCYHPHSSGFSTNSKSSIVFTNLVNFHSFQNLCAVDKKKKRVIAMDKTDMGKHALTGHENIFQMPLLPSWKVTDFHVHLLQAQIETCRAINTQDQIRFSWFFKYAVPFGKSLPHSIVILSKEISSWHGPNLER